VALRDGMSAARRICGEKTDIALVASFDI